MIKQRWHVISFGVPMVHTRLPITFGFRTFSLLLHCVPISRHGYGMWSVIERPSIFQLWSTSWRRWNWPIPKIAEPIWPSWPNTTRKSNNTLDRIFAWRTICSNGWCPRACSSLAAEFSQVNSRSSSSSNVSIMMCSRDLFSDQNLLLDQCHRAILLNESFPEHWLLVLRAKGALRNPQRSRLDGKQDLLSSDCLLWLCHPIFGG